MADSSIQPKYVPGTYPKLRPSAPEMANRYIREWEEKRRPPKEKEGHAV